MPGIIQRDVSRLVFTIFRDSGIYEYAPITNRIHRRVGLFYPSFVLLSICISKNQGTGRHKMTPYLNSSSWIFHSSFTFFIKIFNCNRIMTKNIFTHIWNTQTTFVESPNITFFFDDFCIDECLFEIFH